MDEENMVIKFLTQERAGGGGSDNVLKTGQNREVAEETLAQDRSQQ